MSLDEVIAESSCVTEALDNAVHEAGVAGITQPSHTGSAELGVPV